MGNILHGTFSNQIPCMKMMYFDSNLNGICSNGFTLQHASNGSDNGLAPNRRQAIIWTNDLPVYWRIYALSGFSEMISVSPNQYGEGWLLWYTLMILVMIIVLICPWSVGHHCAHISWWRHQMETFSALLIRCAGNSPLTGEFPSQRPMPRSFGVFFDLRLNKQVSKQSIGWWFEMPSSSL